MENKLPKVMLADDLTGAMDAGVQLRNAGHNVRVIPGLQWCTVFPDTDWLVINTASRNLTSGQSRDAIRKALCAIAGRGTLAYIKVDSTLRGNIGAELYEILKHDERNILH